MIDRIKKIAINNYSFLIGLSIFLFSILIISPWGNYAVNDDWQFFTHVRYFSEGSFIKNPLIDASFILQGFLGLGWTSIFGLSFTSLRILTILFTIIFLIGFYKLLKLFKIDQKLILVAFFCLLLEPFIVTSSLSFMTEIYFLAFMVWSLYFFLKFTETNKSYFFFLAIFIGSLSILIRQFGIVLFIGFIVSLFYIYKFNKKSLILVFLTLLLFASTTLINLYFPQYSGVYDSKEDKILDLFVNIEDLGEKIGFYPKYLVYAVFFLSPFLIIFLNRKDLVKKILISLPLAYLIFSIDIFDLKNVFHLECYYCESNFYHEYSLFDNVPFKLLLSSFLSYLLINVLFSVFKSLKFKKISLDGNYFVLLINAVGMFFIILAVDSFYDRYFINFDVLLIILIAVTLKNIKINLRYPIIVFGFMYTIILFLNIDFHNSVKNKWNQSMFIHETSGKRLKAQILSIGTFSRYLNGIEKSPEELVRPVKFGVHKCFVLRHIKKSDNLLINFFDLKIFNNKYINNPTFSNISNIQEIPKTSRNLHKTIQVTEYFSPMFNLLGQKTYIISFCEDEVVQKMNLPIKPSLDLK